MSIKIISYKLLKLAKYYVKSIKVTFLLIIPPIPVHIFSFTCLAIYALIAAPFNSDFVKSFYI